MGWQVWSRLYSEGNEIKIHKRINPTFKSMTQIKNEESITEKEVLPTSFSPIITLNLSNGKNIDSNARKFSTFA